MRAGVLTIAIAALFAATVGACGSDAPSTAETTAIGQKALTQFGGFSATESAQHCAGSTLVERLGGDGAEKVASLSDITKLQPDQRGAVVAALDHCASVNGMVALSAQALGITSASDPKVTCLSRRLHGKVGTMYIGLIDP